MKKTLLLLFLISITISAFAQVTIVGKVTDNSKEPLIRANVLLKESGQGTITDFEGNFSLVVNKKPPFVLHVSYLGFQSKDVNINSSTDNLSIILEEESSILNEVVISASRVEEKILESPVTIEKLDLQTIKTSASPDFFEQMTKLKGVTTAAGSMTFNAINTRGFGGVTNNRFVQLVDGIDNSAPLLNFPLGNLIGLGETDIKNIELVPGAASALYGPNAFNGIMIMNSKSPFDYEGLTVSAKVGFTSAKNERSSGGSGKAHPLYGADIRYAKTFGKFGFKVTGSYFGATDWLANDYKTDLVTHQSYTKDSYVDPQTGEKVFGDRPFDFNGTNTYGDEGILANVPLGELPVLDPATAQLFTEMISSDESFQMLFSSQEEAKNFITKNFQYLPTIGIRRTGLTEQELLTDRKASSIKGTASLHYKPKDNIELSYAFRIGSGNSVYQGSERFVLKNFYAFSNKIEAVGKNFMLRSYMTQTNAGDSYNLTALGSYALELMSGTEDQWASTYLGNFVATLMTASRLSGVRIDRMNSRPNLLRTAFEEARLAADATMPAKGTQAFQDAIETIRGTYFQHADVEKGILGGAAFKDNSRLFHTEGTYDFTSLLKEKISILVGANHRMYSLFTDGTVFNEDPDGTGTNSRIKINEYGGFIQATKKLIQDRWRLSASLRYDKNENFKGVLSPRVASVVSLGKNRQHNIRTSFQTGFRNPDTQAQFIYFPSSNIEIGGTKRNAERYGLHEGGAYSRESFNKFKASYLSGNPDYSLLEEDYMEYIKPEKLTNVEIGYKTVVKNLYIDWNAYFNWYKDFISHDYVVGKKGTSHKGQHINGYEDFINSNGQKEPSVFYAYTNMKEKVKSWGSAIGLNYRAKKGYNIRANYNYMDYKADKSRERDGVDFNSPNHMFNIGIGNENISNTHLGFDLSYRWQSDMQWFASFGNGLIKSFGTLDAALSYQLKKYNTVFKIGGTNLIGSDYRSIIGGPYIGKTFFAGITYDGSLLGGS
ncbi:MAG: carboxypeptidase-like regulatory domain-containing protein [Chitinophagales bacterium]|nr:carboxypeptidase-like regulatory domain-containing protein [Chitinophagales bacterium]